VQQLQSWSRLPPGDPDLHWAHPKSPCSGQLLELTGTAAARGWGHAAATGVARRWCAQRAAAWGRCAPLQPPPCMEGKGSVG
jgi:hypothetical protein